MKKYFVSAVVCLLFCITFVGFANASPAPEVANIKVFIDDELQNFPVYENNIDNLMNDDTRFFVPLKTIIEKMGGEYRWVEPNVIYLTNHSLNRVIGYRNIFMKLENGGASYQVFWDDNAPEPTAKLNASRVSRTYLLIDDLIYLPLNEFPQFTDLSVYRNGGDILIYTRGYYETNKIIYGKIGHQKSLTVHINDIKIDSPVFQNTSSTDGLSNFSDYILLIPALEALGAQISIEEPNKIIAKTESLGQIEFRASASVDTTSSAVTEFDNGTGGCYIVDNNIYIEFVQIRIATDGSLSQNDSENMSVYTSDYERLDIPANLEEAYKALDELLDPEDIEYIKNLTEDDIISMHFGLGMWIRNNWLYPTNSRLTETLLELNPNFGHPDNMSHFILVGYFHYLNNGEYSIDTYREEIQRENSDALIRRWSLFFVFIFTIAAVRFFFRKLPRPIHLLEKAERFHFVEIMFTLCVLLLLIIRLHDRLNNSWFVTTYSVGYVSVLILAFMFIVAVVRFLFMLLRRSNNLPVKKTQIILQIISIVCITVFLLYYIDYVSIYEKVMRYSFLNFTLTYKQNFYLNIIKLIIFITIITATFKLVLKKLPRPAWLPEKIGFLKIFRVLFVLCASTLFMCGIEIILSGSRWSYAIQLVNMVISALFLAFAALFCFVDMTKKQIAVSAILPTIYFLAYGIESEFFSYGIGYGFFGFPNGDVCLWDYVFPIDYIFSLTGTIGSYWSAFLNIIFAFLPFVFVLLARSKKLSNHIETVSPLNEISDEDGTK